MNQMIAINDLGYRIGQDHHKAKYTNHEVEQVFILKQKGHGYKNISKIMDMPVRTVRSILNGSRRNQIVFNFKRIVNG